MDIMSSVECALAHVSSYRVKVYSSTREIWQELPVLATAVIEVAAAIVHTQLRFPKLAT